MIKKIFILYLLFFVSVVWGANDIILFTQTPNANGITWASGGGNNLVAQFGGIMATGGTVTNYTLNGTNYTAHIFTNNGTFIVSGGLLNCEILVVAGGGGGGGGANQNFGGGGGGGGLVYNASIYFGIGEYLVNVGVGGTGDIGIGGDGGNSTITN